MPYTHTHYLMKRLLKLSDDTIIISTNYPTIITTKQLHANRDQRMHKNVQLLPGLAVQLHQRDPNQPIC